MSHRRGGRGAGLGPLGPLRWWLIVVDTVKVRDVDACARARVFVCFKKKKKNVDRCEQTAAQNSIGQVTSGETTGGCLLSRGAGV